MSSRDALIIALPPASTLSVMDGDAAGDAGHWWRVIDGQVTQSGDRLDWLHPSRQGPVSAETAVMALAPAADITLHRAAFPRLTPRQAEAAARLLAAEQSIAAPSSLHVAVAGAGPDDSRLLAVADSALMGQWLGWALRHGLSPDSVVPAALLLPEPRPTDNAGTILIRAVVGQETILRSADTAFVADEALVRHIVGSEGAVQDASAETIERAMVAALDEPPLDLRSGKWAKSPPALITPATLRRAAMLIGLILLVSLAILGARIIRVHADTAALDGRAAANVATALRDPPPIDQAIVQLDNRLAALGGGTARLSAPFAALVAAMEPAPTVAIDTLAWRNDGTLSVTLGAARPEDINVVLLALQARGFTITATPRSGTDGRALGDITIRSAP